MTAWFLHPHLQDVYKYPHVVVTNVILLQRVHVMYFFLALFPSAEEALVYFCIQHCFICRPSDNTVSADAGIEPRTCGGHGKSSKSIVISTRNMLCVNPPKVYRNILS